MFYQWLTKKETERVGDTKRKVLLIIDMTVFTFVGCDNTNTANLGHIGFTDYSLSSDSSISYILHNSSDDNIHDYAILIGA